MVGHIRGRPRKGLWVLGVEGPQRHAEQSSGGASRAQTMGLNANTVYVLSLIYKSSRTWTQDLVSPGSQWSIGLRVGMCTLGWGIRTMSFVLVARAPACGT